jgi:hypothetical protein
MVTVAAGEPVTLGDCLHVRYVLECHEVDIQFVLAIFTVAVKSSEPKLSPATVIDTPSVTAELIGTACERTGESNENFCI